MTAPVLIFDLDGTLVDSAPDLTHALNHTLAAEGLSPVTLDDVRFMVGLGARRLIEQGVEWNGVTRTDDEIDLLLATFLDYYSRNLCVDTRLFPGAAEVITDLSTRHKLGICTNKPEELAVRLIVELGHAAHFPVILGADSLPYKKPDARHVLATRDRLDPAAGAIMIGDSMTDVSAARNAGIPVIAVSFGYSAIDPKEFGADILIERFADLPSAVGEIMRSGLLDRN